MDACDLKFEDQFFDLVIDKATIDTILCGSNPYLNAANLLKEV